MKNTMKYLLVAVAGMGVYALYKKYTPNMLNDIASSVEDMSDLVNKEMKKM